MRCEKCKDNIGAFYEYEGEVYCFDCVLKELNIEAIETVDYYIAGEFIEHDLEEVLQNLGAKELE